MITLEQAKELALQGKKNCKITRSFELLDRFAFLVVPNNVKEESWDCVGTYVYKKDGHIGYGIPTVTELEKAVER